MEPIRPFHFGFKRSQYEVNSAAFTSSVLYDARSMCTLTQGERIYFPSGSAYWCLPCHHLDLSVTSDKNSCPSTSCSGIGWARYRLDAEPVPSFATSAINFPALLSAISRVTSCPERPETRTTFTLGKRF